MMKGMWMSAGPGVGCTGCGPWSPPLVIGDGLSNEMVNGIPGREQRGKQDRAQKTTTAPRRDELVGVVHAE